MIIHYIFLSIVFSLVLLYRKRKEKYRGSRINKILFAAIVVSMVLFVGLRDTLIGTDTPTYVTMFETDQWSIDNIEVALPFVGKVIHLFTDRYFIFLTMLSLISLVGIFDVVKNRDFDTEIFIYLYMTSFCYLYSATAIRFFCAFSIILLSFKYMIAQKTLKVLSLILIATLFHTSAVIFIPLYFITRFKYSRKNIMIFIAIIAILSVMIELLGNSIFNIGVLQKYSYIGSETSFNFGPSIIINIAMLIVALLFHGKIKDYKPEYEFNVKMLIIGSFVDILSIAYRVVWYFRFPVWFIIPIILANTKKKDAKTYMALYILTLIMFGIYYYYVLSNSLPSHNFLDYRFNLELK